MEAVTGPQPPASILTRVDRLEIMLGYLEELRGIRGASARSPGTSTASSGAVGASDGGNSSVSSSPRSLDRRRCRPITDVVVETQLKGNLIDRVDNLEIRLLRLEEDIVMEKKMGGEELRRGRTGSEKKVRAKGLKRLVKSCVKGNLQTKD